jgi:lipoyl(octanoyl) transferase
MKSLTVFKLGVTSYDEALSFQFELVERVKESKGHNAFLILLEHQPVITLGKNANSHNVLVSPELLKSRNIELKQTNRGGDVTYHGPGQLVGYPILGLSYFKKTMREYVHLVEQTLIQAMSKYGIKGFTKGDRFAGVWTRPKDNEKDNGIKQDSTGLNPLNPLNPVVKQMATNDANSAKIGFIGMRVTKGVTYHGFSFNVNNDLDTFKLINPCGMKNPQITSLSELTGRKIPVNDFMKDYIEAFKELFETETIEVKTRLSYIPKELP